MRIINYILYAMCLLFVALGCSDNDFGKHSDIDLPIPVLKALPEEVAIGAEITIEGENFIVPNTVTIGETALTIISQSETKIVATLPRIFTKSPITVRNIHNRTGTSPNDLIPKYPTLDEIEITQWPGEIEKGKQFVIKGKNVDLINEIVIAGKKFAINGLLQSPDKMSFLIPADLAGTHSRVIANTVLGKTFISEELPMKEFQGELLLTDFEDGNLHFMVGDPTVNYSLDSKRNGITSFDGDKFFSFYVDNTTTNEWLHLGSLKMVVSPAVSLAEFADPHFTFVYNTGDHIANFQFAISQSGSEFGGDISPSLTGNPLDNGMLHPTHGEWEWVSIRMADILVYKWGGGEGTPEKFNPKGELEGIHLVFKQIRAVWWNGTELGDNKDNTKFKLNIDQLTITDGPKK